MRITVYTKPGSRVNRVEPTSHNTFTVRTVARPVANQANEMVIELLAEHLGVAPSQMEIVRGLKNRVKIIEVFD